LFQFDLDLIVQLVPRAIFDTLWMMLATSFFACLFGLPLGLLLYASSRGNFWQNPWINKPVSILVDAIRAIPFIILAAYLYPVTRLVVGKAIGNEAMIFVLSLSAIPFYARMVEVSLRSVDKNLIEAVQAMGASRMQLIREVILPEARSSLVSGFTVTVIAIVAASAMAGFVGGGGLGTIAINYGYQRYNLMIMTIVIFLLVVLNFILQWFGDTVARKLNHSRPG